MGPIWDAELRVWDAKNFGLVSPGTHRNKFVKKSLENVKFLPYDPQGRRGGGGGGGVQYLLPCCCIRDSI